MLSQNSTYDTNILNNFPVLYHAILSRQILCLLICCQVIVADTLSYTNFCSPFNSYLLLQEVKLYKIYSD